MSRFFVASGGGDKNLSTSLILPISTLELGTASCKVANDSVGTLAVGSTFVVGIAS